MNKFNFNTQIITVILLFSAFRIFGQNIDIKGVVTDSLKNPLEYVNIGIQNKSIGTVTNKGGIFYFTIAKSMQNDTLRISSLGYKIPIKSLLLNKETNIILNPFIEKLEEVVITSTNTKTYVKGKKRERSRNEVFFAISKAKNQNLGSEIGRKFKLGKKKPSLLKEFKFFIKNNNFDFLKFRINFYTIKDKYPNKKINTKNVFIEVKNKYTGWVIVDLSDYNIKVQENIIVSSEWVEGSKKGNKLSLPLFIPSLTSTHYYKYGSQAKWKKYGMISTAMVLTYKQ